MAHPGETDIDTVQRHVREGVEHIARQREIVDRLPPSNEIAGIARALLAEFEGNLRGLSRPPARLLGSVPPL